MVKEELCEEVVAVRRRSDRVMSMIIAFGREIVPAICAYAPQTGRNQDEKVNFYNDLSSELDLRFEDEMASGLGDFNGHVGKNIDGFEGVHGGNGIGTRNGDGRRLREFCDEKELCVPNTWYKKKGKRKVTFSSEEKETEVDFIAIEKNSPKYLKNIKIKICHINIFNTLML